MSSTSFPPVTSVISSSVTLATALSSSSAFFRSFSSFSFFNLAATSSSEIILSSSRSVSNSSSTSASVVFLAFSLSLASSSIPASYRDLSSPKAPVVTPRLSPTTAAAAAVSINSSMASSLVILCPAWTFSSTNCPNSVGTSDTVPLPIFLIPLVKRFPSFLISLPKISVAPLNWNFSAITSKAD